jgi:hypothetical protein
MIKVLVISLRRSPLYGSICVVVVESVWMGFVAFISFSSSFELEPAKRGDTAGGVVVPEWKMRSLSPIFSFG